MTDIRQRLIDGMRGQGIKMPTGVYVLPGDWLLIDGDNLELIADRLLSLPGIAIVDTQSEAVNDRMAEAIRETDKRFHRGDPRYFKRMARAALAAAVQAQEEQP